MNNTVTIATMYGVKTDGSPRFQCSNSSIDNLFYVLLFLSVPRHLKHSAGGASAVAHWLLVVGSCLLKGSPGLSPIQ